MALAIYESCLMVNQVAPEIKNIKITQRNILTTDVHWSH